MNIKQLVVLKLRSSKNQREWEKFKEMTNSYQKLGFIGDFACCCMIAPGDGRYNLRFLEIDKIVRFLNDFIEGYFVDEDGTDYYETEFKFL